jgi:hypothetical protein
MHQFHDRVNEGGKPQHEQGLIQGYRRQSKVKYEERNAEIGARRG